jgi:hypothetical protein
MWISTCSVQLKNASIAAIPSQDDSCDNANAGIERALIELMQDKDPVKSQRVFQATLQMPRLTLMD